MNKKVNISPTQEKSKSAKFQDYFSQKLIYSLLSILLGVLIGVVIMSLLGYNPSSLFKSIFEGNFSSITNFGNFLSTLTWLTFLGFAMLVSFRAGLFNIGISAQMVGGGLAGYLFAALVNSPGKIGIIPSILIPVFVGMLIALLIGFLKNNFRIHEVVSSIMLNWSIYWIYRYFLNPSNAPYLYNGGTTPINIYQQNSLQVGWLTNIFPGSTINIAILILIVVIPVIWFLYNKTTFGVKQDIIGNNKDASIYTGLNANAEVYKAMALSGALAGMAGAAFYLGTNQSLTTVGNDLAPEAFNGITIALIGFNTPMGIVFGSIFIALFENSKVYLSVYANKEVANIIPAIIIWFLAITNYFILYEPHNKLKRWLNEGEVTYHEFEQSINKLMDKNEKLEFNLKQNKYTDEKVEKINQKIIRNAEKINEIKLNRKKQIEAHLQNLKQKQEENEYLVQEIKWKKESNNYESEVKTLEKELKKNNDEILILNNKLELFDQKVKIKNVNGGGK